jgi:uncharacterized protein
MLQSTFLHLPRVGVTTEQRLWKNQINTWDQFLESGRIKGFSSEKKTECDDIIAKSKRALHKGDSTFFLNLPSTAHWRLWPHFNEECLYVDIETNWHNDITVLGIYDGRKVKQFIKGQNLTKQAVKEHLQGKLFVTYNGASFDLPIIRRYFGDVIAPTPHFDTMHLARRLGYSGGLKKLEVSMGIRRPESVVGMSGQDALTLWDAYRTSGEEEYLTKLLAYNEEDIVNLAIVAKKLVAQASSGVPKEFQ